MALHDPIPDEGEQPLTLEFVANDLLELRKSFVKLQDSFIAMRQHEMRRLERELKAKGF